MSLESTLKKLYALAPKGAVLGLDRVRAAAEKLGNVHELGKYVHVAGTNGKGSTAAFVTSMAERAGMKVGLYTSPHLCRFAERVRIGSRPIADGALDVALTEALKVSQDLTFFETATLGALLAFREAKVDLVVLEVGLGGRLDATNVVEGQGIQAVTRVAFDHMDRLGSSLAEIAREKGGIARAGQPLVIGRLHPEARASIEQVATEVGAKLVEASSREHEAVVESYPPSLGGMFQRHNATVAVAIGEALGLRRDAIGDGLMSTRWPGRCEILETSEGYVLLDCAHNADGALALKNTMLGIASNFPRRSIALVFGAMADKNWKAMVDRMVQVTGPRWFVEIEGARKSVPAAELAAWGEGQVALSLEEAMSRARERVGRSGIVVVTGSIFLVGAARAHLLGLPCDPPVALLRDVRDARDPREAREAVRGSARVLVVERDLFGGAREIVVLVALGADDENGTRRRADDVLCDAPQQEVAEPGAPVRAHHDEIRPPRARHGDDRVGGRPEGDVERRHGLAKDARGLAAHPLARLVPEVLLDPHGLGVPLRNDARVEPDAVRDLGHVEQRHRRAVEARQPHCVEQRLVGACREVGRDEHGAKGQGGHAGWEPPSTTIGSRNGLKRPRARG